MAGDMQQIETTVLATALPPETSVTEAPKIKKNPQRKTPHWEIGVIYRNKQTCRLFLAVSEKLLLTIKNGEGVVVRPYAPESYSQVRSIAVEELALRWKVTIQQMDEIVSQHLKVVTSKVRTAPRGSTKSLRLAQDKKDQEWRDRRTVRFSANPTV